MESVQVNAAAQLCDAKCGPLPSCAPLAVTYTPMQQPDPPKYGGEEALTRGTLFPGLDLPLGNAANTTNPYAGTPLGELMALDFMIQELNLYLDMHADDAEAFAALQSAIALSCEGQEKYARLYGPLTLAGTRYSAAYDWTKDPWPWERTERTGK